MRKLLCTAGVLVLMALFLPGAAHPQTVGACGWYLERSVVTWTWVWDSARSMWTQVDYEVDTYNNGCGYRYYASRVWVANGTPGWLTASTSATFTITKSIIPTSLMTAALMGIDSIAPRARPRSVVRMSIDSIAPRSAIQTTHTRFATSISSDSSWPDRDPNPARPVFAGDRTFFGNAGRKRITQHQEPHMTLPAAGCGSGQSLSRSQAAQRCRRDCGRPRVDAGSTPSCWSEPGAPAHRESQRAGFGRVGSA